MMTLPKPPGSENDPVRTSHPIPIQFPHPLANVACEYHPPSCMTQGNVPLCLGHCPLLKPPIHSPHYSPPFKSLLPPLLRVPGRGACRRVIPTNLRLKNLGAWTGSQRHKQSQIPFYCPLLRLIGIYGVMGLSPSLRWQPRTTQSLKPSISNFSTLGPSPPPNPPVSPIFNARIPYYDLPRPQMLPTYRKIHVQNPLNNEMHAQTLSLQPPVKPKRETVLLHGRTSSTLNSHAIHPHHHR